MKVEGATTVIFKSESSVFEREKSYKKKATLRYLTRSEVAIVSSVQFIRFECNGEQSDRFEITDIFDVNLTIKRLSGLFNADRWYLISYGPVGCNHD